MNISSEYENIIFCYVSLSTFKKNVGKNWDEFKEILEHILEI